MPARGRPRGQRDRFSKLPTERGAAPNGAHPYSRGVTMTAPHWSRGRGAEDGRWSIGAVLDQLRHEFPDVTISKIRFLESEGLVSPARSDSGYRQLRAEDLERR